MHNTALNILEFEESRRKSNERSKHLVSIVEINGLQVEIDTEILPLVNWLNSLPTVNTQFSCRGEIKPELGEKPTIVFYCEDFNVIEKLARLFEKFTKEKSVVDCICSYFIVELYVESYNNKMRYSITWQDFLAMQDFTSWLGLQKV